MKIYLFSGKARHGKDSACNYIMSRIIKDGETVAKVANARRIKNLAREYLGWDGNKKNDGRSILQKIGTEVIRKKLDMPDFHAECMRDDIMILSEWFDNFVACDVRFPNEIDIQRENFDDVVAIRVIRENFATDLSYEQQSHESETALDDYKGFDYIISAKNLSELYDELDIVYDSERV